MAKDMISHGSGRTKVYLRYKIHDSVYIRAVILELCIPFTEYTIIVKMNGEKNDGVCADAYVEFDCDVRVF